MQKYIGTKLLFAKPMTRQEYLDYRGWTLPADENGADDGFLVEYMGGGKANHPDHNGYISWSPADVFNRSYHLTKGLTFGQATEAMRLGHMVSRSGWNGKGMFIYLVREGRYPPTTKAGQEIAMAHEDGLVPYGPYLAMKTAQQNVVPWLASQTDVLAEDWEVLD
jgi:hypothetical protein